MCEIQANTGYHVYLVKLLLLPVVVIIGFHAVFGIIPVHLLTL